MGPRTLCFFLLLHSDRATLGMSEIRLAGKYSPLSTLQLGRDMLGARSRMRKKKFYFFAHPSTR